MTTAEQRRGLTRRASIVGVLGAAATVGTLVIDRPGTATATAGPTAATPAADAAGGIYLIGDSWAAGLHADPSRALGQVAAEVLRAGVHVDAVSGTGYVSTAGHQNYLQRARTAIGSPRLVIVQGGSNDQSHTPDEIRAQASATWAELRRRFPSAHLLALGPGPDPEPVTDQQRAVDVALHDTAEKDGVEYVSMLRTHWIPELHSTSVIDPSTHHPTVGGQIYLGTRLAASVRLLHPTLFV